MFLRINKISVVVLLLCIASIACATPIMPFRDVTSAADFSYRNSAFTAVDSFRAKEAPNFNLPVIQSDFLKPPISNATHENHSFKGTSSLPAVPAAILMTFIGFLCVTWVKDCKAWLAFLVSLVWLGHAGITAVPQMALAMCQRTNPNDHIITKHGRLYLSEKNNRQRSDIDGTKYISLLHYLEGIPATKIVSHFYHTVSNISIQTDSSLYQFAILGSRAYLDNANNCTVPKTGQYISFSPAFIFANLARGPPF